MVRWIWNPKKNRTNKRDHGIDFGLAQRVFDDPLHASRPDDDPDEERWQTVGSIGLLTVLVIHTSPKFDPETDEEIGSIISARKAMSHERKIYEEGEF